MGCDHHHRSLHRSRGGGGAGGFGRTEAGPGTISSLSLSLSLSFARQCRHRRRLGWVWCLFPRLRLWTAKLKSYSRLTHACCCGVLWGREWQASDDGVVGLEWWLCVDRRSSCRVLEERTGKGSSRFVGWFMDTPFIRFTFSALHHARVKSGAGFALCRSFICALRRAHACLNNFTKAWPPGSVREAWWWRGDFPRIATHRVCVCKRPPPVCPRSSARPTVGVGCEFVEQIHLYKSFAGILIIAAISNDRPLHTREWCLCGRAVDNKEKQKMGMKKKHTHPGKTQINP